MKKILIILLAVILPLTACSQKKEPPEQSEPEQSVSIPEPIPEPEPEPEPEPSPQWAVTELLQSAKKWDIDKLNTYLPEGKTVREYVPEAMEKSLARVLQRMEYKIGEAEIKGDAAYVELEITAVDAEGAMNEAVTGAIAYIAKKKLTGQPVDDYAELVEEVADSIDVEALPTKTETVTAYLVRGGDGKWKLDLSDEANLPMFDAVSGGSVRLAGQFKELAARYGITADM